MQPSKCNQDYWFVDGEITGPAPNGSKEKWKEAKCEKNKQALLNTTHSGPVKYCETSPIYICAGAEILKDGSREEAKAKFDTCLDNSNQDKCTSALNADALQRGDGGPYTSPTPQGMNAPIGDDCNVQYWYCKDKIYREQEKYDEDTRCEAKQCILKDEFQCLMTGSYYWCCEGP